MGERTDDLQYKGLMFIQDDRYFSFGTDAVLLARFSTVKKGEKAVDFGTGTGIIPVLLAKDTDASFFGIELQEGPAALAERNVRLNGLEDRVTIINGDIRDSLRLTGGYADVVICNPPYDRPGSGAMKDSCEIRLARYEIGITLEEIVSSASGMLQTAGRLYMIHRAKRTAELIYLMKQYRLEPKQMRFVQSQEGKVPGYVLVKCVKDGKEGIDVLPPLIMYDRNGELTDEVRRMYHIRKDSL